MNGPQIVVLLTKIDKRIASLMSGIEEYLQNEYSVSNPSTLASNYGILRNELTSLAGEYMRTLAQGGLSEKEETILYPAVREAALELYPFCDILPASDMVDCLQVAQGYIRYFCQKLEQQLKEEQSIRHTARFKRPAEIGTETDRFTQSATL